jgi:hypothetical protein
MKKITLTKLLALTAASFISVTAAQAQSAITFSTFGNATNAATDIFTAGTLVSAEYYGYSNWPTSNFNWGLQTFNGVAFTAGMPNLSNVAAPSNIQANDFASSGVDYYPLLNGAYWVGGAGPLTLTLSGLTNGQDYQIELWAVDTRSFDARSVQYSDGLGNTSVAFRQDAKTIIMGTFQASGATQTVQISDPNNISAVFSAYELRAVPEPSTWAMLLGGLGMLTMFRRRRA